jgi:hypothetical protein
MKEVCSPVTSITTHKSIWRQSQKDHHHIFTAVRTSNLIKNFSEMLFQLVLRESEEKTEHQIKMRQYAGTLVRRELKSANYLLLICVIPYIITFFLAISVKSQLIRSDIFLSNPAY